MRITKESLLRIARENVSQRIHARPDLVAAYLTGSLLQDEPLLGNTTDIDLVFVHPFQPSIRREIVPLSAEIHLDIKYNPRSEYENPRELRTHPWLGPELYAPMRLFDASHFFDFVQAGVRDKYYEPANSHRRGSLNAQHARNIWSDLPNLPADSPHTLLTYLKSVNHAANAIAVIQNSPLSERRFLLQFQSIASQAGFGSMTGDLVGILGGDQIDQDVLVACLPDWAEDFSKAGRLPSSDVRLHPARLLYYQRGFETLLKSEQPLSVLWGYLHTWCLAADLLTGKDLTNWTFFMNQLGMIGPGFERRCGQLDAFLDKVENVLDNLAALNGINDMDENNISR